MIVFEKWAGMVTNASPYSLPPGAGANQSNLQCLSPGKLTVRRGMTAMALSSADSTAYPIRMAFRYQSGTTEQLVYQDSTGKIFSTVKTGTA